MIGPDALATLDAGCAPARQWHVARPSPAASRSSEAALRLRLEHVTKARRSEDVAHIPHPSDGDPPIFPGAFFPRTAHPNSVMLSSHERRDTKRLCLRSVVWGSCYRLSKCTRSNICPL